MALEPRHNEHPPSSRNRRQLKTAAIGASVVLHAALFTTLAWTPTPPPQATSPLPVEVSIIDAISLANRPAPPAPGPAAPEPQMPEPPAAEPPKPDPPKPTPARNSVRQTSTPRAAPLLVASDEPSTEPGVSVSDAELASAATAGSGGGAGLRCDMVERVQDALHEAHRVQNAFAEARRAGRSHEKAIKVWDGDWLRRSDQAGDGLAAVREVIIVEVGFAPEACRRLPVRGLVALTLSDQPGAVRLVLGRAQWGWSDLLFSPGMRRRAG